MTKYTIKMVTAGEGGVGKTTLLHRYVDGKFIENTLLTIGVQFFFKPIDLGDGNQYNLQLWDLGGEDQFKTILTSYISGAKAAILMFDLTRLQTLAKIHEWIDLVRFEDPNLPILFVGSKLDLVEKINVDETYINSFIEKYKFFDYLKVSSKTGEKVDDCFIKIAKKVKEILGI